jgi:hypothetical protein
MVFCFAEMVVDFGNLIFGTNILFLALATSFLAIKKMAIINGHVTFGNMHYVVFKIIVHV